MRIKKVLFYITIVLIQFACYPDLDYEIKGYKQKIIVDASIESDSYAKVALSLNMPLSEKIDSTTYFKRIIRDAKVSISDGDTTEILTAKWDRKVNPPKHYYIGNKIKGEEGKKYELIVEKGGYTIYAETSIPKSFQFVGFTSKSTKNDTLKSIEIQLNARDDAKKSYMVFTKKSKDSRYIETPVVFNSALNQMNIINIPVSPYPDPSDPSYQEGSYFNIGDTVFFKICAIDSVSTQFYKDLSMFPMKGANVFASEVQAPKSNITEPGFGIWCGMYQQTIIHVIK